MKILLVGPPGSGKTTIARHLASRYSLQHISYRDEIKAYLSENHSKTAKYLKKLWLNFKPFPAEYGFLPVENVLKRFDHYVLDGYPKSGGEAKLLAEYLSNNKNSKDKLITFILEADPELLFKRLISRVICPKCSFILSVRAEDLSLTEIRCPNCKINFVHREDDVPDKIKYRINRSLNEKAEIVKELRNVSVIKKIDASKSLAFIINETIDAVSDNVPEAKNELDEAEKGARLLMGGLGLNLSDPNLIGTPMRVAKSMKELTRGSLYGSYAEIKHLLGATFPTDYKGMVVLEPIKVSSICAHHLLPVLYEVHLGYIPKERTVGFSKLTKAISLIAANPILQEDFTHRIVDFFNQILTPKGIIVIVKGKHTCMSLRGDKPENTNTTYETRGEFNTSQKAMRDFLSLSELGRQNLSL